MGIGNVYVLYWVYCALWGGSTWYVVRLSSLFTFQSGRCAGVRGELLCFLSESADVCRGKCGVGWVMQMGS
jgi:hypothetical protein